MWPRAGVERGGHQADGLQRDGGDDDDTVQRLRRHAPSADGVRLGNDAHQRANIEC